MADEFDIKFVLKTMKELPGYGNEARKRIANVMLTDEEFLGWIFNPPKDPDVVDNTTKMYKTLVKAKVLRSICEAVEDNNYQGYSRSSAAFLYSIANIAINGNNQICKELSEARERKMITRNEYERDKEEIEKYNEIIQRLLKCTRKIVKKQAKQLAKDSYLPKKLVQTFLFSVPDKQYINKFKIGYYLSNILKVLYSEIEESEYDASDVDWEILFKGVFGKENVVEVATFVLLEGVHRISQYKTKEVRDCWDSLTKFALNEIEKAPETLRTQMIELYIKRIAKMFMNRKPDLRIDLTSLDSDVFPNLVHTIGLYKDKIVEILNKGLSK